MFLQRVIITFTLGPLFIWLIYMGGYYYFLPVTLLLLLGVWEYVKLMNRIGYRPALWLLIPSVALLLADGQWPQLGLQAPALLVSLLAMMSLALWRYESRRFDTVPADWLTMVAGLMLLGWLGSHFFRLRGVEELAWQWTTAAIVTIWMADSAAYVFGKWLGRHKLARRLSPNKTIEGYVGGIVGGIMTAQLLALLMGLPAFQALVVGAIVSILAPLGDLGISLLKREAGMKDSGNLLPGHGGSLDRTDSLIWSVALAYYLLTFWG